MNSTHRPNLLELIRNRFHPLWRIRRSPFLHSLITRLDFPVWVKFPSLGMRMRVLWFRDLAWVFPSLPKEPELNQLFENICAEFQPKVFWDIGANLGWYCWLVNARSTLSRAVLFEPLPVNAKLLSQSLVANGFHHIRLVQSAVADRCGDLSFTVDNRSGATSQISELYAEGNEFAIAHTYGLSEKISITCTTMDSMLEEGEPVPDLMKMDVEEAEALALKGATKLLERGSTIIVFECHRREAIDTLLAHNYEIFAVDKLNNYLAIPSRFCEKAKRILAELAQVC